MAAAGTDPLAPPVLVPPSPPADLFGADTAIPAGSAGSSPVVNASANGADIIPFPYPQTDQGGIAPAGSADIPDTPGPLTTTGIPVPDTTQIGATPAATPGRAYTEENTDYQALAAQAPGVTAEQTVQGQLTSLFANKDANPLWQYAQNLGTQYANTRGLVNSDIAAEAGAQAVFAQAMPIAQQDANTFAARAQQEAQFWQTAGLQAFQATIASGLQAQAYLENMSQLAFQGDINSRLQLEQYGYNFQLNSQQNIHNMQLAALQGDIQSELALQQFGFDTNLMRQDHGYRLTLMDVDLRNALRIGEQNQDHVLEQMDQQNQNALEQAAAGHVNTLDQIAANGDQRLEEIGAQGDEQRRSDEEGFTRDLQQNYLNAVERRTGAFSAEVQNIYNQQGLTPAQQANAIRVARDNYLRDLDFIKDQYSSSPYWDNSWGVTPAGTPGDTSTPPPTTTPPPPDASTPPPPLPPPPIEPGGGGVPQIRGGGGGGGRNLR